MVLNETSRHRTCLLLLQLVAQDTNNKTARNNSSVRALADSPADFGLLGNKVPQNVRFPALDAD